METKLVPFSELLEAVVDNRGKTCPTADSGIPLIATNCVKNENLYPVFEKVRYVSKQTYDTWFRGHPMPGDLVFVTKGTPGRVVLVPDPVNFCIAQDAVAIRANKNLIDPYYLFALLRSRQVQEQITNLHVGSLIPHFKKGDFDKLILPLPAMDIQKKIGQLYLTFSKKIELNNQINETLEAMAKAIFKEWFIDFGPVKAKAEGKKPFGMDDETAALFPDCFEESELGLIPKGWGIASLSEVSDFQEGPGIMAVDFHESGVPLIRLSGLKNGVSLLDGCNFLDPAKVETKWRHFKLTAGDILLSTSASLGRVAEVDQYSQDAIAYTGIIRFRALTDKIIQIFLKHFLISNAFQLQVEAFGVGSVLKHFGPTHLKGMKVLVPSLEIQEAFQNLVKSSDSIIKNGIQENFNLSQVRDLLLPKLISGELSIDEAVL